ncbi:amino acid adenylation domain-containing protein (plasmid) [Streptomyces althioticus]|uniref:Amino acid adenylation domain-containing protein n=1 Tax=Streptomyces althioticus TaxID=83380 RepID=A0ABZ1YGC8_9ACTN|nr:amino acid adenylation domain-containing protein [Streptomyces cellulosae]WTC60738.1 amino acid adenylation domain-containing protein [Streptomyces cellulosae]
MADHGDSSFLPRLIQRWATATPDAAALDHRGQLLTYRELDRHSDAVAAQIRGRVPAGSVVALITDRSPETVCTLLGILKAGCTYLPVDPDTDGERVEQTLRLAQPDLTLATPMPLTLAPAHSAPETRPSGPAYVMPTSGSGGVLKLVEVEHRSVCHNLTALAAALGGITPEDVCLHVASFAFSSSVRQLFLPLIHGARVVLATGTQRLDPRGILHLLQDRGVSVMDVIPSVLSVLLDELQGTPPDAAALLGSRLRLLLLASEPLPGVLAARWQRASGRSDVALYNMYGQTESTGIVSIQRVDAVPASGSVPIGRPLPGTGLLLLDDRLTPVPDGEVGEIAVTGPALARGYRANPAMTTAAFPQLPGMRGDQRIYRTGDLGRRNPDGTLTYIGRQDRVIKVHGQRVDLAHVETALEEHPAVARAAVTEAPPEEATRLRAWVQLRPGYLDETVASRLRTLPDGLRVLDLHPAETDFMHAEIVDRQVYLQHGITVPAHAFVIDAGANIGLFSLSIATRHPDARILAYEPAAPTAAALRINLSANGCSNVTVRPQGLSDHTGDAEITWYPRSSGMSSLHASRTDEQDTLRTIISNQLAHGAIENGDELHGLTDDLVDSKLVGRRLPCSLVRLSDVLDTEADAMVDLLKVDVQKAELEVLSGIDDAHWPRIKQIVAEVHDIDDRLSQMTRLLTDHGYQVHAEQDEMFTGSAVHYLYARRPDARPASPRNIPTEPRRDPVQAVSRRQLTAYLAQRFPTTHVPGSLTILAELPRTTSGKIDRAALAHRAPAPDTTPPEPEPADPISANLAGIWSSVLGTAVHSSDDFFAIGGSSLAAARVIARIRHQYPDLDDLSVRLIFEEPVLRQFAAAIRAQLNTAAPAPYRKG